MSEVAASVIVLSWNSMGHLGACLDAILAQKYPHLEVIVVDNGSHDGSVEFVEKHYAQVRLIQNHENLGFAGGNNVGLRAASGEVLVLLNDDTEVHPGWLRALIEGLLIQPGIGIAGAKAIYPNGTLQHAGGRVDIRGQGHHPGTGEPEGSVNGRLVDPDYVTGNSLAITRQALADIGPLDEGFSPIYYEDVDWCFRAKRAGYRVVYVPDAVLTHKEVSAVARPDHQGMYLQQRNRLRFVLKHWPLDQLQGRFLEAESAWLEGLSEGGERLVAATHHAYLVHLLHLADVLEWRRKLLGASATEAEVIAHVLLELRATVPLRPAKFDWEPGRLTAEGRASRDDTSSTLVAAELRKRAQVREVPFRSNIPGIGRLIAGFRHRWNRISTQWYVRPLLQQQNEFNAWVVHMLERLAEVGSAYQQEDGREIAELASEIHRLKTGDLEPSGTPGP